MHSTTTHDILNTLTPSQRFAFLDLKRYCIAVRADQTQTLSSTCGRRSRKQDLGEGKKEQET